MAGNEKFLQDTFQTEDLEYIKSVLSDKDPNKSKDLGININSLLAQSCCNNKQGNVLEYLISKHKDRLLVILKDKDNRERILRTCLESERKEVRISKL